MRRGPGAERPTDEIGRNCEEGLTRRLVGSEMTPVDRAIDTEDVTIRTEVDRMMFRDCRGQAVSRSRLRRVVGDDRSERDQRDETEQQRYLPICRDKRRLLIWRKC